MSNLEQSALPLAWPGPRKGEYPLPPGARIEKCKSCGAEIVWAQTEAGRPIPLSLATVQTRDGRQWLLSHFADCPESRGWRRR
jgi:hypothetical protein